MSLICLNLVLGGYEFVRGVVLASHHNCRELVDNPRQLSDDQIKALIDVEQSSAVPLMLGCFRLTGSGDNQLQREITYTLKMLQTTLITSSNSWQFESPWNWLDLDGGFGTEQSPSDLNTIADIGSLEGILSERGYSGDDINAIMYGNFISFCKKNLPQE